MIKRAGSLILSVSLVVAFLLIVTLKEAHAYIDPGSGSFLLQMLLATVFASIFAIKAFWQRLTGQVSRFFSKINRVRKNTK